MSDDAFAPSQRNVGLDGDRSFPLGMNSEPVAYYGCLNKACCTSLKTAVQENSGIMLISLVLLTGVLALVVRAAHFIAQVRARAISLRLCR